MNLAVLQARTSSSRLPGKVLKPILGVPMLVRQIERLRGSRLIDGLIVATSTEASDDAIEQLCRANKVECFRGQLNDVLDRFYQAAKPAHPDHVVRLTGDCPLSDPQLIDKIIDYHLKGNFDYTSNTIEPTYPDGLDAEVFRFACLEKAWREAKLQSEREHVTPFLYKASSGFKTANYKNNVDLSALRWTVDEPLDLELVEIIYGELYPSNPKFTTQDILDLLNRDPRLKGLNVSFKRNEGYQKSLEADRK